MLDHYRMFADYNRWANQRVYAAAAELSDAQYRQDKGAFFGSLHGTLNHLLAADRIWMKRFTGQGEGAVAARRHPLQGPCRADGGTGCRGRADHCLGREPRRDAACRPLYLFPANKPGRGNRKTRANARAFLQPSDPSPGPVPRDLDGARAAVIDAGSGILPADRRQKVGCLTRDRCRARLAGRARYGSPVQPARPPAVAAPARPLPRGLCRQE